jgi:uncharacterized membrane protein
MSTLDPPDRVGQGRPHPSQNGFRMARQPPPQPTPPPKPGKVSNGLLATFGHRPRLLAGAAIVILAYIPLRLGFDIREATRLLIAWNAGALAFFVMILIMATDPRREARVQSRPEDENQWVLVVLGIVAALAAIAAIVWELGPVKDMSGWAKAGHLVLVGLTVLSAWTFLNVMFGLHYAGVYFKPKKGGIHAGLEFPATPQPGWMEFFYQAFVIGCTFASSDVNVTSMRMRRIVVIQGVVGFFFNAIILALTINVTANLF